MSAIKTASREYTYTDDRTMLHRIHILGASGSGTTTLGRALAEHLQCPHFDTDDYFWVLSGSLCGWGDVAIPLFELVVFLQIPHDIRMERLRQREHQRFGARIL